MMEDMRRNECIERALPQIVLYTCIRFIAFALPTAQPLTTYNITCLLQDGWYYFKMGQLDAPHVCLEICIGRILQINLAIYHSRRLKSIHGWRR
jgi:hypothetical protein